METNWDSPSEALHKLFWKLTISNADDEEDTRALRSAIGHSQRCVPNIDPTSRQRQTARGYRCDLRWLQQSDARTRVCTRLFNRSHVCVHSLWKPIGIACVSTDRTYLELYIYEKCAMSNCIGRLSPDGKVLATTWLSVLHGTR